jgi:membrane-bound metal-dependent hydrolase YbcI (DUF457 family)
MNAGTHLAFAGLVGVALQGFGIPLTPELAATIAVGSLLPDLDTTSSGLGKFVKPVSGFIERKFGHRTVTHSFVGLALLAAITTPLLAVHPLAWWYLFYGALSHVLLDTLNMVGVPLLWPSRIQFWFVVNRAYRVPYGSPLEATFAVCFALAALLMFPLSQEGFSPAFHRFLGTPSGVVADYLEWRDSSEVYAEVDGFNSETQERIGGRYRVIDAIGKEGVIVETSEGDALGIGFARGASVTTYHVHAARGSSVKVREYRLELSGRTVGDLLSSLPRTSRVWVTANLQLTSAVSVPPPRVGHYRRVQAFGRNLEVRSATVRELEPLELAFVEKGTAVIRAEFAPGETVTSNIEFQRRSRTKTHVLEIPNLPSLAGLVVKPGDQVFEGSPLARYVNDQAIEAKRAEYGAALTLIASGKTELEALREDFERTHKKLEQDVIEARANVKRYEFLVGANAEPAVKLLEARARLRDAETSRVTALSQFTSRRSNLEARTQKAQHIVRGAKATISQTLEAQFVKSPIEATVSAVKVKNVGIKGVTLEVVLLENITPETSKLEKPSKGTQN